MMMMVIVDLGMAREFENAKHPEHSEGYKGPRHLRDFVDEDDYKEEDFEDEDDNESQTVIYFDIKK